MTEGEEKLREEIWRKVYSDRQLGMDQDTAVRAVALAIEAVKAGEYFVYLGEIREVGWCETVDWLDTGVLYTIRAEYTAAELEEDE